MMRPCPETVRVQAFLDDDLPAHEAEAFRVHLATCTLCATELTAYTRLLAIIDRAPIWDPGPRLTERILDRVVPSRARRRFVTGFGWTYSTASAISTFALISWLMKPDTPRWIASQLSELYLQALRTSLLTLHTVVDGWVRFGDGWSLLGTFAQRLAPLGRALTFSLAQPVIALSLAAALIGTVLVLWWMRPGVRIAGAGKGVPHVDLLGF
jgi:anti-sigma factor RsiW